MQSRPIEPHPQSEPVQSVTRQRRCRHIFTAGHQCGSPCLRSQEFCYYHHTTRRPVSDPGTRRSRTSATGTFVLDLPNPEDRDAIRAALGQIMQALAQDTIAPHRASVLIYTLQTALAALPKEPVMPLESIAISAAAASRKPKAVKHIPAKAQVNDAILDHTHGLIAPQSFLEPENDDQPKEEDPGDTITQYGRPLRRSLPYKLLMEVEMYEARQEGYEEARADLRKDGKLRKKQPIGKAGDSNDIDIDAAAEPAPLSPTSLKWCHPERSLARTCDRRSRRIPTVFTSPLTLEPFYPEYFRQPLPSPKNAPSTRPAHLICLQSASDVPLFPAPNQNNRRCCAAARPHRLQPLRRRPGL